MLRDSAELAARELAALPAGTRLLLGFRLPVAAAAAAAEDSAPPGGDGAERTGSAAGSPVAAALDAVRRKGFRRLVVDGRAVSIDDVGPDALSGAAELAILVDRIAVGPDVLSRLTGSLETAYHEGGGAAFAIEAGGGRTHRFSERFECVRCGIRYELPQPSLFSFNNPQGACSDCHGFGNVIELDMGLVVPDESMSIRQNAIEPWSKPHYRPRLAELKRAARSRGVRMDVPWSELTGDERAFVVDGDGAGYTGIRGFFRWLETKKYKVHVRVFLSRYRGYLVCPACHGTRLRQEARCVQVGGRTIDAVCALTVARARPFFDALALTEKEAAIADRIVREIRRRLAFLSDVGLDYLTLDRLSSTLSGGEAQRINLATSLGSALVGTLYVLDEPSVGLHPRDNDRLLRILRQLRDQGKHGAGGRARYRHDPQRRLPGRSRPGGGHARREGRLCRSGGRHRRRADVADRQVSARRPGDTGASGAPQAAAAVARHPPAGGGRAQPEGHRRRNPDQPAHLRYRRKRVREVDARP